MNQQPKSNIVTRPPIVVVMGHIDHGKTTLLDAIRRTNVAEKESGAITQHIGAYETQVISSDGKSGNITFIDTPGHEAFSKMRSRGARVADIAILVVAADDGVKPQTLDALRAIKEAQIPFIVAINKIDKSTADPERIKKELAEHEVYVEEWGGKIPTVLISAKTGAGIAELLEMILLMADLEQITADYEKPATGVVIESHLDSKRGNTATFLITEGTLSLGEYVIAGDAYAPVRFLEDFRGRALREAHPSQPVRIAGFNILPPVGIQFRTVPNREEIGKINLRTADQKEKPPRTEMAPAEKEKIQVIPLVIKADTLGSLEAIEYEIKKITANRQIVRILRSGVGTINEDDIKIAASGEHAAIVGFNVKTDAEMLPIAERFGVNVKTFTVIYELTEWLKTYIVENLQHEKKEEVVGKAIILKVFSKKGTKQIVGGRVSEGVMKNKSKIRIVRRDQILEQGRIIELQQGKSAVTEVVEGNECGMRIDAPIEIAPKDVIEAVEEKIIKHEL